MTSFDDKTPSIVGYNVKLLTKTGETYTGTVWNEDKQAGLIILSSPATSGTPSLNAVTMLKMSQVSEVISAKAPEGPIETNLTKVDFEKLQRREEKAVERMERQIQSRGVGVTERAQRLFDQLSKTMPCKWAGKDIEVFEAVHISAPYTPLNCDFIGGCEGNTSVMERLLAVLPEELKKLDAEDAEKTNVSNGDTSAIPAT